MSDYSGPYDGRQHEPSEMRTGADKGERARRPEGEDRPAEKRRERPGDEGEGEEGGERSANRGTGGAAVTEAPD